MTTVTEAAVRPFQMNVSEEDVANLRGQGIFNFGGFWWAIVAGGSQ